MKLQIKELREKKHLSTYQMAKLMNITQSAYSRFENAKSKIDLARLESFAEVIGMSVVDVLMYPDRYVNVRDIPKEMKVYEPDVIIQLKVRGDKREQVLSAVLGDNNLELLK